MDAKVTWIDGLSFDATANSGFVVRLGADPAVGGANDGFRPLELMAMSLAGCTAMDVISILRKKQQKVTSFEVRVHADRAPEHPKVFTHLTIEYDVRGQGVDESAVRRAIELSASKYCPAQAMLSKIVPTDLKYVIYEVDHSQAQPRLVVEKFFRPAEGGPVT
ncbi:MAG: OsmC family protein [Anaerolineales bacterium]|nr:OsmC family protein [Anaerolineales bacterium]MCX7609188.1 OsmC family protein [Anaerolineales bacterium]MDW8227783.1 OsmC family protein [Anaerolineales bacterium]